MTEGDAAEPARRRRAPVLAVIAAVVLAVIAMGLVAGHYGGGTAAAGRAPTFSVTDLRDEHRNLTLSGLRGRPVVLNFWATWCVPCRKEMPAMEAVHRSLGTKVTFLGIDNRDSRREAIAFLHDVGVDYDSGFDPGGQIASAYAILGMPTTVFISADGQVLAQHTGQLNETALRESIRRYFALR